MEILKDKTILVTGGTGSFGTTVVKNCLARSQARRVIVYSRDEQKHVAMQRRFQDSRLQSFVGDVRDRDRLRLAMRGVDFVFNAAAIKHVPLTEEHPMEAVQTNVLGARLVCETALDAGVEALVSLSTDKAVEPVNVMGMSKALQERVVASYAGKGMRVSLVRYGNVLASNGSVIPYFKDILQQGNSVLPVTDRRMTRFVLTLEDSVDLVLYAMEHGSDGEIFVLDLPAFRIWDVAEVMADAASTSAHPVVVEEIGIRPGEKLHESLISAEEMRRSNNRGAYWKVSRNRSGEDRYTPNQEEHCLRSDQTRMLTRDQIAELLREHDLLPNTQWKSVPEPTVV